MRNQVNVEIKLRDNTIHVIGNFSQNKKKLDEISNQLSGLIKQIIQNQAESSHYELCFDFSKVENIDATPSLNIFDGNISTVLEEYDEKPKPVHIKFFNFSKLAFEGLLGRKTALSERLEFLKDDLKNNTKSSELENKTTFISFQKINNSPIISGEIKLEWTLQNKIAFAALIITGLAAIAAMATAAGIWWGNLH